MALLYVKNYPIKQPFGMEPFRSVQNILNRVSITYKERSTLSIFGISPDCINSPTICHTTGYVGVSYYDDHHSKIAILL